MDYFRPNLTEIDYKYSVIPMCQCSTERESDRERVTPKDIMKIMGFQQKKAYQYYNKIRARKPGEQAEFVFVDDLVAATGMNRNSIKSSLHK